MYSDMNLNSNNMKEIKAGDIMLGNYIQSPYGNYPIAEIGYKDDESIHIRTY